MAKGVGLLRRAQAHWRRAHEAARMETTNEDFARQVLGRSRSTVHRWETGQSRIPRGAIALLRGYLERPMAVLSRPEVAR